MGAIGGGFRTHLLLPHLVVGSIIDDKPTFRDLTVEDSPSGYKTYYYQDGPILRVSKRGHDTRVTAMTDIWLQEPSVALKLKGFDGGSWIQGLKGNKPVGRKYTLIQKDAQRSTVHFMRYPFMWNYVNGFRVKDILGLQFDAFSDGGFASLLSDPLQIKTDWLGCRVFSEDWELHGTKSGFEMLKRWEASGARPDIAQIYFHGWTGGAGCVVNNKGSASNRFENDKLWQPRSWRMLKQGKTIRQSLVIT